VLHKRKTGCNFPYHYIPKLIIAVAYENMQDLEHLTLDHHGGGVSRRRYKLNIYIFKTESRTIVNEFIYFPKTQGESLYINLHSFCHGSYCV